jgi:hypothetical protein
MKMFWGVKAQLHAFLTLALDVGEGPASRPSRFPPRCKSPATHSIRGWVRPRVTFAGQRITGKKYDFRADVSILKIQLHYLASYLCLFHSFG